MSVELHSENGLTHNAREIDTKGNHLYFHTPSEPPLFKGDSRDVKNKK